MQVWFSKRKTTSRPDYDDNSDYSGIGDDDSGPRTALATFDSTVTAPPPNIDQEVEKFHRTI